MVERHRGAKSKVVLIPSPPKSKMDTKERKTGNRTRSEHPDRRPRRTRSGIRHTALAAKNEIERRKDVARGEQNFFSTHIAGGRPIPPKAPASGEESP
jgi:hypothetical protein